MPEPAVTAAAHRAAPSAAPLTATPRTLAHRLGRQLLWAGAACLVSVAVALALWQQHVAKVWLDESLRATAATLARVLQATPTGGADVATDGQFRTPQAGTADDSAVVWQLVAQDGRLLQRSRHAPTQLLSKADFEGLTPTSLRERPGHEYGHGQFVPGLPTWRVLAVALHNEQHPGLVLLVAQREDERQGPALRVALASALVAALAGLPAFAWLWWLRRKPAREIESWSKAVQTREPLADGTVAAAPALELQPVQTALMAWSGRVQAAAQRERVAALHFQALVVQPQAAEAVAAAQGAGVRTEMGSPASASPSRLAQWGAQAAQRLLLPGAPVGLLRLEAVAIESLIHGLVWPVERAQVLAQGKPLGSGSDPGQSAGAPSSQRLECADPALIATALAALWRSAEERRAKKVVLQVGPSELLWRDDGASLLQPLVLEPPALALATQDPNLRTHALALDWAQRVAQAHGGALRWLAVPKGLCVLILLADLRV